MKLVYCIFTVIAAAALLALTNSAEGQPAAGSGTSAPAESYSEAVVAKPIAPIVNAFNFSHWKLTLPVTTDHTFDGDPLEISARQLNEGYSNQYFSRTHDGHLMFWAPVTGVQTDNTDYPRCELREMLEPGDPRKNWMAKGSHILTARCKVLQVPSSLKVVIGQIHSESGKKKPLVKLQFFKGRIEALVKSSPTKGQDIKLTWPDIKLNSSIDYQIHVQDEILSVTVNGVTQTQNIKDNDADWMKQTFYFKAGVYPQDNEGDGSEGGRVSFSKLTVDHQFTGTRN